MIASFKTRHIINYLPTSTIVVQVHQTPRVFLDLSRIQESPRIFHAEPNVRRTTSPLPSQRLVAHRLLLLLMLHHRGRLSGVATALRNVAFGTGGGDGVNCTGTRYRIGEGRLTGTYQQTETYNLEFRVLYRFIIIGISVSFEQLGSTPAIAQPTFDISSTFCRFNTNTDNPMISI